MLKAWMLGLCLFVAGLLCLNPPSRAQLGMTGIGPGGFGGAGAATFTFIDSRSAAGVDAATTSAWDTTGITDIIVGAAYLVSAPPPALTDNKSNSFTALTASSGTNVETRQWYIANPTVGSGHTFTFTGNGSFVAFGVLGFSGGTNATPFDVQNGNTGAGTSPSAGSVTPSQNNELVIALVGADGSTINSIDGGFTITQTINYGAGANFGVAMARLIQGTAAPANPTWTLGASQNWAGRNGTYKN